MKGDEIVGVQLQSSSASVNLKFAPVFTDHKAAHRQSKQRHYLYSDTNGARKYSQMSGTSVRIHSRWMIP